MLKPREGPPPWERILIYGEAGAGKTTAWLTIAKWSQASGSPAQFYWLDSDGAADRMLKVKPDDPSLDFTDLRNVHVFRIASWEDLSAALKELGCTSDRPTKLRPMDWLILDPITKLWEVAPDYWARRVYGESIEDFIVESAAKVAEARERRAKGERVEVGSIFDRNFDWQGISYLWRFVVRPALVGATYHVLVTALAEEVTRSERDAEIRRLYGAIGFRPRAQKDVPSEMHTQIFFAVPSLNHRIMTTVNKDRQRPSLQGVPVQDFCMQYLIQVAGWEI